MPLTVTGLAALQARLNSLPTQLDAALQALITKRAREIATTLAAATPVRTGRTQGAWRTEDRPPMAVAVVNDNVRRNFLVASGLITGTGSRGQAVIGYKGGFRSGWPGQAPNAPLRTAWEQALADPLVNESESHLFVGIP